MRLIQLSDTHGSARHRMLMPNIGAIATWLRETAPGLIDHTIEPHRETLCPRPQARA